MAEWKPANGNVFQNLPISDNFMFGEIMRIPEICKLFLESLLEIGISRIEVSKEKTISDTPGYHGIRLDVYAKGTNERYNVEMFSSMKHKPPLRRARYYQGMMDRLALETGMDYIALPESYVIFVCNFDYFGTGQAVCRRKMVVEDREDVSYDDGSHVYLLNSCYSIPNASGPICEFLDFVRENDADRDFTSELMRAVCPAVKTVRGSVEKEEEYMVFEAMRMDLLREGRAEGRVEGRAEGRAEGFAEAVRKFVVSLYRRGISPEDIASDMEQPVSSVLDMLHEEGCI